MNDQPYLDWLLGTTPSAVRSWLGDNVVVAALRDDLSETVAGRKEWGDRATADADDRLCEAASASDYHLREVRFGQMGLSLLAGIHFYGMDRLRPFVGIYAQSREISRSELASAVDLLQREFEVFKPPCVRVWSLSGAADLRELDNVTGDGRLLVGNLAEILAKERPPLPSATAASLSLEPDPELGCYDRYVAIYEVFLADHPQWRGRLSVESRKSLEECADRGSLYRALMDGEFAGLIAARPGRYRGIPGWAMVEELLDKPFRGLGLAPTLQRKFLERLDPDTCALVWGTIEDDNLPSLRTALRNGRVDVGGQAFVYPVVTAT